MQEATQKQTRRETLKLFRDRTVWSKPAPGAVPANEGAIKIIASVKYSSISALLPKERFGCDMATD